VHPVGFTIEIYYDARPYGRQIYISHNYVTCTKTLSYGWDLLVNCSACSYLRYWFGGLSPVCAAIVLIPKAFQSISFPETAKLLYGKRKIEGESLAIGPKLLYIKSYVIEIMTWKFIYTYRERCKTGTAHNRCWNWSPFTSKYTWMRFSKFCNTFPKESTLTAWISWRRASLSCPIVLGCIFVHFALQ